MRGQVRNGFEPTFRGRAAQLQHADQHVALHTNFVHELTNDGPETAAPIAWAVFFNSGMLLVLHASSMLLGQARPHPPPLPPPPLPPSAVLPAAVIPALVLVFADLHPPAATLIMVRIARSLPACASARESRRPQSPGPRRRRPWFASLPTRPASPLPRKNQGIWVERQTRMSVSVTIAGTSTGRRHTDAKAAAPARAPRTPHDHKNSRAGEDGS